MQWKPKVEGYDATKANLIIFGPVGQGKSSLINSMVSLWYRTSQQVALALPSAQRVTTKTAYFTEHAGFGLLDTQGSEEKNYLNSEFELLLKGALPYGHDVVQGTADMAELVKQNEATAKSRQIHSCIFVANQSCRYLTKDDKLIMKMKQFMKNAKDSGLSPILAVTKMDEVKEDEVKQVQDEIVKLLEINPSEVFLIYNDPDILKNGNKPEMKYEKVSLVQNNIFYRRLARLQ